MVLFNHATREMTAKIVYYGPGLCGKTTNLLVIYDKLDANSRGKMLSLATKSDRTLFFDLLPVDIGKVGPFNLKIQLYTVPGQVFYNETRKLVLKGADAVVFVADSQDSMLESNRDSYKNLLENLAENQIDINEIPVVVQYNKRDLPGVLSSEELTTALGFDGYPSVEASAIKGEGVMETFKLVSKITAKQLVQRFQKRTGQAEPAESRVEANIEASAVAVEEAPPSFDSAGVESETAELETVFDSPDVNPGDDYENVEEVSLESLLEGRDRPLTFAGDVPIPELPSEADTQVDGMLAEEVIEDAAAADLLPLINDEGNEVPAAAAPTRRVQDINFPAPAADLVPARRVDKGEPAIQSSVSPDLAAMSEEIASLRNEVASVREQQREMLTHISDALSQLARALRPE